MLAWIIDVFTNMHWGAVGQIIMIDILLGGDNAVVIALACRNLPKDQRSKGVFWGTAGAIILRVKLFSAIKTIIVADMVMSIDNVIAIAGAAQQAHEAHQTMLVIFGLLVSVPFIVGGSQIIMKILDKFPVIVLFGGAMLGWIAGGLFTSDSFVVNHVPGVESWKMVAEVICALIVLLAGLYTRKKIAAKKAASAS